MRRALIPVAKILGFLGVWALLLTPVVMAAVLIGGEGWFANIGWRLWVEIGGAIAVLAALAFMAFVIDKRGAGTIGFPADASMLGLLWGALLGAALFALPLLVLTAIGAARWAPDLADFTGPALGLSLVLCFFNVVTQETLVRSYIFQELWKKYGVAIAIGATTLIFLALHAAAILQGTQGAIAGANIALASVMLGLAYVRSGALWLPIGIHLGWNALQGPVLGINVTGNEIALGRWRMLDLSGDPLLTGGAMGVEGGLIGLIGPALGVTIVALAIRRKPSG
jgi:membrane protease YdiL (CAAX protease family)